MKITFNWLKDHLKTDFKEKNLLDQLTNIGLEVESVDSLFDDNKLIIKLIYLVPLQFLSWLPSNFQLKMHKIFLHIWENQKHYQ